MTPTKDTSTITSVGTEPTPADLAALAAIGITKHLAVERAGLRRVTHTEARDHCGIQYRSDHLEGLAIPYLNPDDDRVLAWRVRRDHPEVDRDGKSIAKYLSSSDRKRLYFAPGCRPLLADTSVPVIIVEAEKSAIAILDAEARCGRRPALAIGTGGCWGWRGVTGKATGPTGARVDEKGPLPCLDRVTWTNRDTIIVYDSNVSANDNVKAARRSLAKELTKRGAQVRAVDLPAEAGINGPDDHIGRHGAESFFALVDAAKPITDTSRPEKPKQGQEVQFDEPEPWPEPVDGAALLDDVADTFTRYLALPTFAASTLALWTLHAYTFDAHFTSAILAVTSPAKRCGKTILLIIMGAVAPRPLFAANVTPAVLFRTIEKYSPTLLIDEGDTFLRDNDELRGVLNSGHTRKTAKCIRAVGEDHDPRAFSTWCPKAIALIGRLPGTLEDRSIQIAMRRRTPNERVHRLRQDKIDAECLNLRRKAVRWAEDHLLVLRDADPAVPDGLHDRAADCWRPLFAVADAAGEHWPARAREAAHAVCATATDDDASSRLLDDIRTIFAVEGDPDVLGSSTIVEKLIAMDDRPWAEWSHGRPITTAKLSRLLSGYGIHSAGVVRIGNKTPRGYRRCAFEDAWNRYGAAEVQQRNIPNESGPETALSECNSESECCTLRSATNPINTGTCCGVALPEGDNNLPAVADGDKGALRVQLL